MGKLSVVQKYRLCLRKESKRKCSWTEVPQVQGKVHIQVDQSQPFSSISSNVNAITEEKVAAWLQGGCYVGMHNLGMSGSQPIASISSTPSTTDEEVAALDEDLIWLQDGCFNFNPYR